MTVVAVRAVVTDAEVLLRGRPEALDAVRACRERIDGPLRVALAGTVKAGKSTLLNALVGEEVAPTDATECTRVVTWYRHHHERSVHLVHRVAGGERRDELPVRRKRGGLEIDLGDVAPDEVIHLEVGWPARALRAATLVDTPGTSSLSQDVSARTAQLLTPSGSLPGVDAVVYLMRQLHASDVAFLRRLHETAADPGSDGGAGQGAVGVVGVLSRADEVGAGRLDAMAAARDVAARLAAGPDLAGLCHTVLPVAGLLALGARTLRQEEYLAFRSLAAVGRDELTLALLSVDRFLRDDVELPVEPALREQLVRRFGVFGLRLAVALVRGGTPDAPTLAAELRRRSGLDDLRDTLEVQLAQRSDLLKAHSALLAVRAVLREHAVAGSAVLARRVEALLADTHGFTELRLLGRLAALHLDLPADELAELELVLGGRGARPSQRMGTDPDAPLQLVRARALELAGTWQARARRPLQDPATARACRAAARSAEGVLASLPG
ncbi:dynamin family protein [Rhodococcus antarcticus]